MKKLSFFSKAAVFGAFVSSSLAVKGEPQGAIISNFTDADGAGKIVGGNGKVAAAKRFAVEKDAAGVWWFKDTKSGKRFVSMGVSNVNPTAWDPKAGSTFYDAAKRQFGGDVKAWSTSTRKLLTENGFNTLGCWSGPEIADGDGLYRTAILYLIGYEDDRCLAPLRPDMEKNMLANLRDRISKFPDRSNIIGVFYDNEMPWFGKNGWDNIATATLLERAFEMEATDPARTGALKWLQGRYENAVAFGKAWGKPVKAWEDVTVELLRQCSNDAAKADREAFITMLADKFYSAAEAVVKAELPDMMTLGSRFAGNAPDGVIKACGKHTDVMSVNNYRYTADADLDLFAKYWIMGQKPIMLTEFSFRARENASGNPNNRGAGPIVANQAERASSYASAVRDYLSMPVVIGAHWFEFADQSPQGRFDGEDSNYGIVSVENKPYTELLAAMKKTHEVIEAVHAKPKYVMPTELPKPKGVVYRPGQHPDRPSTVDLLAGPWSQDPGVWSAPDAALSPKFVGGNVELTYKTGAQYGCGFDVYGLKANQRKGVTATAADYDGYEVITMDVTAPAGLLMNVTLLEAAAGGPGQAKYDVGAGDDGESFLSDTLVGQGKRATYTVRIADFKGEYAWGNQTGVREINATAVRNFGLKLSGSPVTGQVIVHCWKLSK